MTNHRLRHARLTSASALVMLCMLGACGGGEPPQRSDSATPRERAFLSAMVPHHDAAIEMAEVARREGESQFVRGLAADILRSQGAEIDAMGRMHVRLFDKPLRPDPGAHAGLGLSAAAAGMDHSESAADLARREPFDRAFVDHVVPHHQGAVRMSARVLESADDPELRRLANAIVAAQLRETGAMEDFREREYGGAGRSGRGGKEGGAGHAADGAGHAADGGTAGGTSGHR